MSKANEVIYAKATAYYCNTRKPITTGKYHLGEYKLQFTLNDTDNKEFAQYFEEHAKEYEGKKLLSLYSRYPFYCESGQISGHSDDFMNIENDTPIEIALRPYENQFGTFYSVVGFAGNLAKSSQKRLFGQQGTAQQGTAQQGTAQQGTAQQVAGDGFMKVPEGADELPFN